MRLTLFILLSLSLTAQAQKRVLKGKQSYWPEVTVPHNSEGQIVYQGEIAAQAPAKRLYEKAVGWIEINSNGPYNQPIRLDPHNLSVEFQRSFNYFFSDVTSIPEEDNKIIVYRVTLSMKDRQVAYTIDHFQHDQRGQLMALNDYLALYQKDKKLTDQIKSQLVMHLEGFVWKNGEEKGFIEDLTRIMNSIAVKNWPYFVN